jgi:cobalt-zinc-cadmium efflux system protein
MPHPHEHSHSRAGFPHGAGHSQSEAGGAHSHEPSRRQQMLWATGITASILLLEAVGGVLSHSLALLTDAGHMLTDLAALLISLAAMIMAERPVSARHTFGLVRLEVLAAFGNSITFFLMVAAVAWEAVQRLSHPTLPDWKTMGIIAAIGFLANALSAWFLHGAHEEDLNMQSAWIHVLGDLASSAGVLIGVGVIAATGWAWVDPVISLGIATLIGLSALRLFRKALHILLEAAPRGLSPEKISACLASKIPEIKEIHHVHLWEVGSGEIHLTAHVVVEDQPLSRAQEILEQAVKDLERECGIQHATLQLESPGKDYKE